MANKLPRSKFYAEVLDAPMKNVNWSWGAMTRTLDKVFLNVWQDDANFRAREVQVFWTKYNQGNGQTERKEHLDLIREGKVKGYVNFASGSFHRDTETNTVQRKVKEYDDSRVFPIQELRYCDDGVVYAVFGNPVKVSEV